MKRNLLVALVSGLLFGIGLAIGGMTQPTKVIQFLDILGNWDPSLAFVMVGAIGVHVLSYRWAKRHAAPLLAPRWYLPTRKDIDVRLLAGAGLFGVGWGLGGYCPGPGVASLLSSRVGPAVFVLGMLAGMLLVIRFESPPARVPSEPLSTASPEPSDRSSIRG